MDLCLPLSAQWPDYTVLLLQLTYTNEETETSLLDPTYIEWLSWAIEFELVAVLANKLDLGVTHGRRCGMASKTDRLQGNTDISMSKDVQSIVRSEVALVLARSPHLLEVNTPLVEYGLDSMRALDIVAAMENEFELEIDDEEVVDLRTIEDIVDCIDRKLPHA